MLLKFPFVAFAHEGKKVKQYLVNKAQIFDDLNKL